MKLYITGASGFVGRHFLTIYDSHQLIPEKRVDIEIEPLRWLFPVSTESLPKFKESDALLHLAWKGIPNYSDNVHVEQVEEHLLFIKSLLDRGLTNIYVAGTCHEYGNQIGSLHEGLAAKPESKYAIGKVDLFEGLSNLKKFFKFNLSWFRFFYLYGNGQHENALFSRYMFEIGQRNSSIRLENPNFIHDFIQIDSAAKKMLKAICSNRELGVVNIASGYPRSVRELIYEWNTEFSASINITEPVQTKQISNVFPIWGSIEKLNSFILP